MVLKARKLQFNWLIKSGQGKAGQEDYSQNPVTLSDSRDF